MPNIYRGGELWLYGYVGESYWDEGFTAGEVLEALAEHGRDQDITVHINSGGGSVYDGLAIYNALTAHKGEVRIEVDAIAASSASLIMASGDHIVMRAGSLIMVHDPSGVTLGTADDHEKQVVALNKIADQMASIYAERTGKDAKAVRASMKEEIWLTADEAVAEGYADEAEAAKAKAFSPYDYRAYAHAPKRLTALAAKKNWRLPDADQKAAMSAANRPDKENTMTDKTKADDTTANDLAKATADAKNHIKTIMTSDEAKGREELAEYLAYETETDATAAIAMLGKAPKAEASNVDDITALEERRLNAEGLNGGKKPGAQMRVDIVADMKRRYGVTA